MSARSPATTAEAVKRWLALNRDHAPPRATERLKPRKKYKRRGKTFAFRLEEATDDGRSVIAKLTATSTARLEHHIYTKLLARLDVPAPTCYGIAEDHRDDRSWIFIEEIEGPRPSRQDPEHLSALGAWLGVLAQAARAFESSLELPLRGTDFIRTQFEASRARVMAARDRGDLGDEPLRLLTRLDRACGALLERWDAVGDVAARWPRTILHGDLTPKNIRVRFEEGVVIPHAFDWEQAGWGNPAIDLAGLVGGAPGASSDASGALLESYAKYITAIWPDVTVPELRACLDYGRLLRLMRSITWATVSIKPGFEESKGGRQLKWFTPWLESALDSSLFNGGRSALIQSPDRPALPQSAQGIEFEKPLPNGEYDTWTDATLDLWLWLDKRSPDSIETLQEELGRSVYRFHGVGDRETLIVKRCRIDEGARESFIYRDVLPQLPVPGLDLHGYVPEWLGSAFLFMEDVGNDVLDPERAEDRDLAGRWLATLHVEGARAFGGVGNSKRAGSSGDGRLTEEVRRHLRNRGPAFHGGELASAIEALSAAALNPVLSSPSLALVRSLSNRLALLKKRWTIIEERYSSSPIPETLVHGDFKEVHLCRRGTPDGSELVAIDWNEAGWGRPAIDVAKFLGYSIRPSVSAYLAVVRDHWPGVDEEAIRELGLLGEVFRVVATVRWAAERLLRPWVRSPITKLKYHLEWTDRTLRELGLSPGRE